MIRRTNYDGQIYLFDETIYKCPDFEKCKAIATDERICGECLNLTLFNKAIANIDIYICGKKMQIDSIGIIERR
jgi:hypothetical protein